MGQICLKSKEAEKQGGDIATLVSEIEKNHSILRLQESEVAQQSHKAAIMMQQVSVLITEKDYTRKFHAEALQLSDRLKRIKPELERVEDELSLAQDSIRGCKIECESIRAQLQTLQTKLENVIGVTKSSEKIVDVEFELEGVKSSLAEVHNSLTRTHKQLRSMEDEISEARQLRQLQKAVHLQAVQQRTTQFENILRFPVYWIENKTMKSFLLWKAATFGPRRSDATPRRTVQRTTAHISNNYVTLTDMGEEEDEANFQVALNDESHSLVESNPLNSTFLSAYIESAAILDKASLSSTLSSLFALKAEDDERRRSQGSEPMLFPAFLLYRYSQEPDGYQRVGDIVRSVVHYHAEESKIGHLWSALLHLDAKTPALTQVSKNITRLFSAFRGCVEKCTKPQTGKLEDRLYLSDAISLINERFARDPKTGKEIITLMKPPDVSDLDFTLFKLLHCMRQQNVDSLGLFRHMDRTGRGKVEIQQLAKGMKDCLGAWVPEADIVALLEHLDTSHSGEVTRLQFLDLNYTRYFENIQSDLYTISLQSLLYCFVNAGLKKAQVIVDQLKDVLHWSDYDQVSQEEFFDRITSNFPEYSVLNLEKMWRVALFLSEKATDEIAATVGLRVLLRYPPSHYCDTAMCTFHADSNTLLPLHLES